MTISRSPDLALGCLLTCFEDDAISITGRIAGSTDVSEVIAIMIVAREWFDERRQSIPDLDCPSTSII